MQYGEARTNVLIARSRKKRTYDPDVITTSLEPYIKFHLLALNLNSHTVIQLTL